MTLEEQLKARATALMPAPARLERFMAAATEQAHFATVKADLKVQFAAVDTMSHSGKLIADKLDDTREDEYLAHEEAAAWASALLEDGTLGDCLSFLINRDQFQQAVAQRKLDLDRPKSRPKLTTLWARFFGQRKVSQAISPTR
ncbi:MULTISPECIES: hypothetical protein [Parasedimentitalea]|uniref:Uncharacterized protein n=2 Tax=Parasedimentitalea TaxID=2738399 RepID=A0A6L6WQQ4_9RHOB|nr:MULTISPECIES: hypothetical protein [Zongyanglinia]KAE9624760.1 hypothetical protein GP644_23160 [Zongyanglinia marina]MVO18257.1 hypothetical protein [Zongyanglinia huanghaiensis]